MPNTRDSLTESATGIEKVETQIEGLDEILHGGLPKGRVTLIGGGPGTGKSLIGLEFLYRGALSGNPGIYLSFEETAENIRQNTRSFGWDLASLEAAGKLFLMEGQMEPEMVISGNFDLRGMLAILEGKAEEMGAERIVIDALDVLMGVFKNPDQEKQQILALHKWLLKQEVTAILTTKNVKVPEVSSPYDYLDFMVDCVIYLDQRISEQVNTKRLQVIKYRGSGYGSNEYPFLMTDNGIFFSPISNVSLKYAPPVQRVSSGNPYFDEALAGGYLKGTCILISGESGTGKTAMASTFAGSACENGQKTLYVNYEESRECMLSGMRSVGIGLRPLIQKDLLWILSVMPESMGIEQHLYHAIAAIRRFQPEHLVMDAMSAVKRIAGEQASFDFIVRLVHFCKEKGITVILINQVKSGLGDQDISGIGVSSIVDTIITMHYRDVGNETARRLQIKKSRGSNHSNRYHNYRLTDNGIFFDTRNPKQRI